MRHDSFVWDMSLSYKKWLIQKWHDSFMRDMTHWCVTRLIHMWHDSFMWDTTQSYETWLNQIWQDSLICDMTHWYVAWLIHKWYDSFICGMTAPRETWLIHLRMWDMTHSFAHVRHDSFICARETWLIHVRMWDMTHSYATSHGTWLIPHMRHDSFIDMNTIELLRSHPMCTHSSTWMHMWVQVHMGCDVNDSISFISDTTHGISAQEWRNRTENATNRVFGLWIVLL